ncbi:unnamed protein product [Effrenium voratum]|nr:unnamed protein product [Effrenium voratum]
MRWTCRKWSTMEPGAVGKLQGVPSDSEKDKSHRERKRKGSRAARLWRLLRSCCAAQRRQLLLQFSEAQRKALEQWILAHPEVRGKLRRSGKPSAVRRSGFVHPRSRSGVHGIETFSRQGKLLYRASAKLGPFRIMTGYCKDLLLAKQHLQALQCSLAQVGATEVPDNLRSLAQAELDLDLRTGRSALECAEQAEASRCHDTSTFWHCC